MDFTPFTHMTFDCYGTLIDWESGILNAFRPVLNHHSLDADEAAILSRYLEHEARIESGPYLSYREVLRRVGAGISADFGFVPTDDDLDALPNSVGSWPPFGDTVEALSRLKKQFKLVILSNIDDAMIQQTLKLLQVRVNEVITAQQLRSYKPDKRNFQIALDLLGVPVDRVLHVAQSLYHDHVPAKALGFSTIWIRRPSRLGPAGIAPQANVKPDLEIPSLAHLAELFE